MRPTDRPVLGEPVDRAPSAPMRTPLGQAMRLNQPGPQRRACCDRDSAPAGERLCLACAATRCGTCSGLRGHHAASCAVPTRRCKGCGAPERTTRHSLYCDQCRAQQCPECRQYAGRHGLRCQYVTRTRRLGLLVHYGVVRAEDIEALYLKQRAKAVRIALQICGELQAEDVVHDVTCYLLAKRDRLPAVPGAGYFLTAVRHTALRKLLYSWARFSVPMDPEDLLYAEQAMAAGKSSQNVVRLPSHQPARSGDSVVTRGLVADPQVSVTR